MNPPVYNALLHKSLQCIVYCKKRENRIISDRNPYAFESPCKNFPVCMSNPLYRPTENCSKGGGGPGGSGAQSTEGKKGVEVRSDFGNSLTAEGIIGGPNLEPEGQKRSERGAQR